MMTNQEIYDRVKAHLLAQRRQARSEMGCAYRGDNGIKCAVGCLIPDEFYTLQMEGAGIGDIRKHRTDAASVCLKDALDAAGFTEDQYPLLQELQHIHDWPIPSIWEAELKRMAYRWGLVP